MDHFNNVMKIYAPDKSLCIDESMMLWRGRLIFTQYIKNKKHKYGIKLYKLCESNGLINKIKIHCGKEKSAQSEMGHASDVVLHLTEDFQTKDMYCLIWFTRVLLFNLFFNDFACLPANQK